MISKAKFRKGTQLTYWQFDVELDEILRQKVAKAIDSWLSEYPPSVSIEKNLIVTVGFDHAFGPKAEATVGLQAIINDFLDWNAADEEAIQRMRRFLQKQIATIDKGWPT